jgi:hypothetical protein
MKCWVTLFIMWRSATFVLFVPIAALMCAFVAYGIWENHHRQRSIEKLPTVISLLDQVQPYPGSVRVNLERGEQASAHEFAAAVVWRQFDSDATCSEVQSHFEEQARKIGFPFGTDDSYNNNSARTFRNGEYEFRFVLEPRARSGCDIAISTNWYGFER